MSASFRMNPNASRAVLDAAERALGDAAEHMLEQANRTVPIEEGTLKRSGRVSQSALRAAVSYDTPYAVRQHENTRLRHDNGRRAKWLERTLNERSSRVGAYIAESMRRAL